MLSVVKSDLYKIKHFCFLQQKASCKYFRVIADRKGKNWTKRIKNNIEFSMFTKNTSQILKQNILKQALVKNRIFFIKTLQLSKESYRCKSGNSFLTNMLWHFFKCWKKRQRSLMDKENNNEQIQQKEGCSDQYLLSLKKWWKIMKHRTYYFIYLLANNCCLPVVGSNLDYPSVEESHCWSWQILEPGNSKVTLLELADTRAR